MTGQLRRQLATRWRPSSRTLDSIGMAAHSSDPAHRSSLRPDWKAEYAELTARDGRTALEPVDLERLGIAAYLAGHESGSIDLVITGKVEHEQQPYI